MHLTRKQTILIVTLKEVKQFSVSVLPTEYKDGVRTLSDAAKLPF